MSVFEAKLLSCPHLEVHNGEITKWVWRLPSVGDSDTPTQTHPLKHTNLAQNQLEKISCSRFRNGWPKWQLVNGMTS